jgi:hypothetical protein
MDEKRVSWDEFRTSMFSLFDNYHKSGFPDEFCLALVRDMLKSITAANYIYMLWKRELVSQTNP